MVCLQVGAIIDILESNFTGNHSRSAVIVANPFVACYNNLMAWDSFTASLSDTENCLTIRFFGYPQDSPLRLADILSNSNANGLRVLAHDRPPTSTKDWIDETNQIWTRKPDRYHVDFLVLQLVAADLLETGVDLSRGRDRDGDDNSADEVFVKIAYKRDHDTTRSVDVDTNWNELFLVLL